MYDDSDGEDDRPFNKANFSSSSGDVEMSVVDAAQQLQVYTILTLAPPGSQHIL